MAGVLFIVNVPSKEYEEDLRVREKKYEHTSKIIRELKKNKKFGNLAFESYTYGENGLKSGKSMECLNRSENGLMKSKSDNMLNESYKWDVGSQFDRKSWRVKQAVRMRKRKLRISRPLAITDVLAAFHWDTPLEMILSEVITQLGIDNATWTSTRGDKYWQVLFSLDSSDLCEELLQVLAKFGIGSRFQSSVSLVPCALHLKADTDLLRGGYEEFKSADASAWSRFSSSVRARTNLAQVLHEVRAEATLTFDWLFLLLVAAFVAAIGLAENSTVIIVASMLISPLMGPVTAATLGTAVRDRSLQQMGVLHELLGLFLALVVGFIFGLTLSAVHESYGVGDWLTQEIMSRCEIRSLWVGVLVAIPSGAGVALAVLGEYTASLVGVAISLSLLPPAVNAGLLWAMALVHLIFADDQNFTGIVKSSYYSNDAPTELAILGLVSLCLTLINIACLFLSGVAVYKIKEVCPLDGRDILWWRANRQSQRSSKRNILKKTNNISWEKYSNWSTESSKRDQQEQERHETIISPVQSDTVTYRRETAAIRRMRAQNIEDYCMQKEQFNSMPQNYDLHIEDGRHIYNSIDSITPQTDIADIRVSNDIQIENFYNKDCITDLDNVNSFSNAGYEDQENVKKENLEREQGELSSMPIIEPSSNHTVDAKRLVVLASKSYNV
ncbi:uncharacterized protein LOC125231843 [Leguminivora glycinivorella]|uniref:uncharacterized protein LOC125231843 n=1 Tax=Leguminivora glycinivorella TaxID=1035111 RepID=UPI00200CE76C|nr:uncharacterized protein LOC125231843 [Leguminivora glycinivorella]